MTRPNQTKPNSPRKATRMQLQCETRPHPCAASKNLRWQCNNPTELWGRAWLASRAIYQKHVWGEDQTVGHISGTGEGGGSSDSHDFLFFEKNKSYSASLGRDKLSSVKKKQKKVNGGPCEKLHICRIPQKAPGGLISRADTERLFSPHLGLDLCPQQQRRMFGVRCAKSDIRAH